MGLLAKANDIYIKALRICIAVEGLIIEARTVVAHLISLIYIDGPAAIEAFIICLTSCIHFYIYIVKLIVSKSKPALGFIMVCKGST